MKTLNAENILSYLFAVGAAAFSRLSLLLIMVINGKVMPQAEFGWFSILILVDYFIAGLVSGGGDLWLNPFTKHEDAQFGRVPPVTRAYLRIIVFLVGIGGVFTLCLPFLGLISPLILATVQMACVYGMIAGFNEGLFAILRSSDRVKLFFLLRDFLCPILLVGASLSAAQFTAFQFFSIASGVYGALSMLVLHFLWRERKTFLPPNQGHIKLTSYTLHMMGNTLLTRLLANMDVLVLSLFLPLAFVGYYRICAQVGLGFQIIQHFTFLTLPWQMSAQNHVSSGGKNIEMIRQRQYILLLSSGIVLMCAHFFAKEITYWMGGNLPQLQIPFIVILWIRFAEITWGPMYAILLSNRKVQTDVFISTLAAGVWGATFYVLLILGVEDVLKRSLVATIASNFMLCGLRFIGLRYYGLEKMTSMGFSIPLMTSMIAGVVGYFMIQSL